WTQEHLVNEEYLITAPTPRAQPATAASNTTTEGRDLAVALLAAEVAVQYQIGDVDAYVKAGDTDAQMREVLTLLADRCVSEYFVTHHVDELLTGGREEAGEQLRANIQRRADELNLGIKVKFVGLAGVHPPQKDEVAASFHKQISA